MEIVELVNNFATYLINIMSHLGPISGIVLIILESILPFLPLSVFIALNGASFGYVFGYIISSSYNNFCTFILHAYITPFI